MQIIPTTSSESAFGFWESATQSESGAGFLDSMRNAMDSVSSGEELSVSAALADDSGAPLVEGPYNRASTDGVTYTLEEVCFTQTELRELRDELVKAGAPESALRQFDILASQPDGATLAQVMASLMAQGKIPELEDSDIQLIAGFAGKLDPTGELASMVLGQMRAGRGEEALDLLRQAFGQLGNGQVIEISQAEAMALGKGLGLDASNLKAISNNFAGFNALYCNSAQFGNLMGPAASQLMSQKTDRELLDAALEKTLKPILAKARNRMAKEKEAAALQNRRVEQSKILIDRTVQEQSQRTIDQTLAGEEPQNMAKSGAADAQLAAMAAGTQDKAQATPRVNTLDADNAKAAANTQTAKAPHAEPQGPKTAEAPLLHERDGQGAGQQQDLDGRQELGKKLGMRAQVREPETRAQSAFESRTSSIVYSMLQGNQNIVDLNVQADTAATAALSRHLASQVENGMLSAMRDGATRLDLQLHPQELGAIGITLTMRNGEVSARIRSEKGETAELVSRQLESIRINLEQQGIKVDKIEVQLQSQDNGGSLWQDLQQHNAWQEEDARREQMARLRNLAGMRNKGSDSGDSVLEQSVHVLAQTARYASQSLHVVA